MTSIIQQQREVADSTVKVIKENNQLKTMLSNLYSEASQKITQSNELIRNLQKASTEAENDATEFAKILYGQGGSNGM